MPELGFQSLRRSLFFGTGRPDGTMQIVKELSFLFLKRLQELVHQGIFSSSEAACSLPIGKNLIIMGHCKFLE
jgi:hypothetical protein